MIKTLIRVGIKGTYLNIIKAIYDKPTASINTQQRKAENLLIKIQKKTLRPTLTSFIQHSIGSLSLSNQTKEIKGVQIEREEVKLSLQADDLLYLENPKESMQKVLDMLNEFSKVAAYKINIQKPVAFLYTSNEILEKEYKKNLLKLHQRINTQE